MNYLEYHFKIDPATEAASDVLAALLADAGFETFEPDAQGLKAYVQTGQLSQDTLDRVVEDFPLPGVAISYTKAQAPNENWNAVWESETGFEPITIGRRFVVFDDRYTFPIRIRPQQAFGSGSHATTQTILQWLATKDLTGRRVIDAGCGTGILGIAAKLCGAEHVCGYDIDEWSVRNAQENAALNGVQMDVLLGDAGVLQQVAPAHLLLANINRNILLADLPAFSAHVLPGGQMVLSGFLEADVPLLVEAAHAVGMNTEEQRANGDWQMLVFTKK